MNPKFQESGLIFVTIKEKLIQYPVIIIGVLVSISLALMLYFRSDELPVLTQQYEDLIRKNKIIDFNNVNAVGLDKDIKKLEDLNKIILNRLLDPKQRADVFHNFFSLEEATGVHIDNPRQIKIEKIAYTTRPGAKKIDFPAVADISYKLDVSGTFNELMQFLYKVQNGHYFIRITGFNLANSKTLQPDLLLMSLDINCFGISSD